jgi:hypothetical protein
MLVVVGTLVAVLVCCASPGGDDSGGGGEKSFTQVSGSGYITVRLMNANGAHSGDDFLYGASGIPWGQYERVGSGPETINSNDMSFVIKESGTDFLFAGGQVLGNVGGIIDVNGNGILDDGDYFAGVEDYTVNGNDTVTLSF